MSDEPVTLPVTLALFSHCLLSKWGFNDGDTPDEVLDYCDDHGLDYGDRHWHDVLPMLVRTYLLPELEKHHTIELFDIGTNHNPIRASTVDGKDIDSYADNDEIHLTPEYVPVPMEAVIAAMRDTPSDHPVVD